MAVNQPCDAGTLKSYSRNEVLLFTSGARNLSFHTPMLYFPVELD